MAMTIGVWYERPSLGEDRANEVRAEIDLEADLSCRLDDDQEAENEET